MKTKWPPLWIYNASNAIISTKTETFALMKAHLWATMNGKAIAELLMGVRNTGTVQNRKVAKSQIVLIILVLAVDKSFALV